MMTTYKFPLRIEDEQTVMMPAESRVICVQSQYNTLTVWAIVDTTKELVPVTFRVVGTGHPMPDIAQLHYVGTVQMDSGMLVWHVFTKH